MCVSVCGACMAALKQAAAAGFKIPVVQRKQQQITASDISVWLVTGNGNMDDSMYMEYGNMDDSMSM